MDPHDGQQEHPGGDERQSEADHLAHRDAAFAHLRAYLGAIPTALAYILFARGLRHLPAGEVATLTLAEPLTAAALGAVALGERPGVVALGGVALVLAGLAALAMPRRGRSRPVLVPS